MKQKRAEKSNHIIEIATEVFSEKGYHGALTDDIAERAEVSKQSLYYYIGDKDKLYETVMNNLLDQTKMYLRAEQDANECPETKIRRLIYGMAQIAKMRPFHSIVMRELFAGGGNLPQSLRKDVDYYLASFASSCAEITNNNKGSNASPIVVAWMVFAFFLHWDVTMPFVYESDDCTQYDAVQAVGKNINDKLIDEVEKLVFKMLDSSSGDGLSTENVKE